MDNTTDYDPANPDDREALRMLADDIAATAPMLDDPDDATRLLAAIADVALAPPGMVALRLMPDRTMRIMPMAEANIDNTGPHPADETEEEYQARLHRRARIDAERDLTQLLTRTADHVGRCMTLIERGLHHWQQRDPSAALIIAAAQAVATARISMIAGAALGEPVLPGTIPAEIGWTGAILGAARDATALAAHDDPRRPALLAALDQLQVALADVVTTDLMAGIDGEGSAR